MNTISKFALSLMLLAGLSFSSWAFAQPQDFLDTFNIQNGSVIGAPSSPDGNLMFPEVTNNQFTATLSQSCENNFSCTGGEFVVKVGSGSKQCTLHINDFDYNQAILESSSCSGVNFDNSNWQNHIYTIKVPS